MAVSVLGTGISFMVSVLLARTLGADGYGAYAFSMSVALLLLVPVSFGLPHLTVREVASLSGTSSWGRLKGHLFRADQILILTSLGIGGTGAFLLYATDLVHVEPGLRQTLAWALPLLPLLGFERVHGAALRGLRSVVKGQIPTSIIRPLTLALTVVSLRVLTDAKLTPPNAMALHLVGGVVAVTVATIWLYRALATKVGHARTQFGELRTARMAVPFLGLDVLLALNSQVDILLLGLLIPASDVGVYRVALGVALFISVFLSTTNIVVQPEVARLYSDQRFGEVQLLVTAQARVVTMATIPFALFFVIAGTPFLRVIYGSQYLDAYVPLVILMTGQVVSVIAGPVGLVLNMTGHERETIRGQVLATVWAVLANVALIPHWGLVGAAVAHASAVALWNLYLGIRVRRTVGISCTPWGTTH